MILSMSSHYPSTFVLLASGRIQAFMADMETMEHDQRRSQAALVEYLSTSKLALEQSRLEKCSHPPIQSNMPRTSFFLNNQFPVIYTSLSNAATRYYPLQ